MNPKKTGEKQPVWSDRTRVSPSKISLLYTAGRDVEPKPPADELLIPYDIWTNRAHTLMLYRQKIISREVAQAILQSLEKISVLYRKNQFHLDPQLEDVHMNIEQFIAEDAGEETAGWLHTGRSRNDQSTTDIRLYVRDRLLEKIEGTIELMEVLLRQAEEHIETVMPGLTHLRFATLTTWAHYLVNYAQALERDTTRLQNAYEMVDQSPLGAVASYGTSWNIDRKYTAELLGFQKVQVNTIDCLTNRWEMEAEAATAICFLLNHLSIIAEDLLIFTLPPFEWVEIDSRYVTGSSIMPQKRNLDFAEVTRAKASLIQGYVQALLGIGRATTSGYNRDEQWTKFIIIDVFDEARYAAKLFRDVFLTLKVNPRQMERAGNLGFLNATEVADYLTRKYNLPFRRAYKIVAEAVRASESESQLALDKLNSVLKQNNTNIQISTREWKQLRNLKEIVKSKKHLGGPAPESIKENIAYLLGLIMEHRKWLTQKTKSLDRAKRLLTDEIKALLNTQKTS